jgi:ribosomal protein S18 acetylase RimI-like enzyme
MSEGRGWRVLDWDTAFWGFPVASVSADAGDLAEVVRDCDNEGIRCAYLLLAAEDTQTLAAGQAAGFRYIDTRIELRRDQPPSSPADAASIRVAEARDVPQLEEIARDAFSRTRFLVDEGFDRDRARELYATWVRGRTEEEEGLVMVGEVDGGVAGFMAGRLDAGGDARHELVAVAPGHRRSGLAGALSDAFSERLRSRGARGDASATQAANLAGLRMFGSRGFEIESFHHWLHRWRP